MEDFLKTNVKLLLVDDDSSVLEVISLQLERQGYAVVSTTDPAKALSLLRENKFDLVITDVAMPKMDGLALLDEIKALSAEIPVILLTGYGSVDLAVEAMKRGAADFIDKPASFTEISIRIERALEAVESKKAYRMLKDQVEELKKACEDLGKTGEQQFQSEKLAAMGVIVSGIAHEINNPLTAVIGYSQLLLDSGGHDMARQLKVVRDQAQRCAKIIQELMFFARRRKPVFSSLNLREIMREAISDLSSDIAAHDISLEVQSTIELAVMQGDGALLKKVFSQVLINAVHAVERAEGKGKIQIVFDDLGQYFQIKILDNGPGIPEHYLPRIFDPFFSTKDVGRGTGLGLSLCYGLIADHGGKIVASNSEAGGALFTITLPKDFTRHLPV